MKTRILISLIATLAVAVGVTPAASGHSASKSSLIIATISATSVNKCFLAPDRMQANTRFSATFKRTGSPKPKKPKKIKIVYTITDTADGTVIASETLNLKPKKYKKVGALAEFVAGHTYQLDYKASFRLRETGKMVRGTGSSTASIGTADQLATLPPCAAG